MPIKQQTVAVCERCQREQIFDDYQKVLDSSWRQLYVGKIIGGYKIDPGPVLCGDCIGATLAFAAPKVGT